MAVNVKERLVQLAGDQPGIVDEETLNDLQAYVDMLEIEELPPLTDEQVDLIIDFLLFLAEEK